MSAFEAIAKAFCASLALGLGASVPIAGAVALATRVAVRDASARHALWLVAAMTIVAVSFGSFAASLCKIDATAAIVPPASSPAARIAFAVSPQAAVALEIVWAIVAVALVARIGLDGRALARFIAATSALDPEVARRLRRVRHRARGGRAFALRSSDGLDAPVAAGFSRPAIVFPESFVATIPSADLDRLALHEYAHLERYDDVSQLVVRVAAALCWFNPIVHVIARRIAVEREIACDDAVVAATGRPQRYAESLWMLARTRRESQPSPIALGSSGRLASRIERLVGRDRSRAPRSPVAVALAILTGSVSLFVALAVARPIHIERRISTIAFAARASRPNAAPTPRAFAPAPIVVRVNGRATPAALAAAFTDAIERARARGVRGGSAATIQIPTTIVGAARDALVRRARD